MTGVESHGRNAASQREGGALVKPAHHDVDHKQEHLGLDGLSTLFCLWRQKGAKYDKQKSGTKVTFWQIGRLVRRLLIFAAALVYISRCIQATASTVRVLMMTPLPRVEMGVYPTPFIAQWAGTSTIRTSPLVSLALKNSTAPINNTIYLESATTASLTGCSGAAAFNPGMYGNTYLRAIGSGLIAQTAYNITSLAPVELIAPVVDCQFGGLLINSPAVFRAFYLVRHKNNTDDVSLLTFSMSIQDYSIPKQKQKGPAGVGTLEVIKDMAMTTPVTHHYIVAQSYPYATLKFQVYTMIGITDDHEWRLLSIPSIPMLETPKEVVTAARTGMFINVETEQSNYRNAYATTDATPELVLSRWRWQGGTVLRDSWGWVHCVHVLFAIDALVSMVVLFMVIYRNLVLGKIWVGDAFVSVSNTLMYRSVIIIATWIVNDGWTLMEFCYANANHISGYEAFYSEPSIIRADLLTLFLGMASVVGALFRERVDPAMAVFLFEIGFSYRVNIGKGYPNTKATVTQYALEDLALATLDMSPIVAQTTPMRLATIHPLASKNVGFILLSLLPTFSMLGFIIAFVIARKVYRHYYPEKLHVVKVSNASEKTDELQAMKGNLTFFEIATGAALQRRVGVVSDYENCLYIKGMKYASADGIYSSGYVIANGKFLISISDLVPIFIIKVIRLRFKNVYVYEVEGSTVQQTARLLYPQTIPWYDLLRLNISVLS